MKDFNKVSLAASSVTASQNCSSKGLNDKQTIVLSGDKGAEDVVSMVLSVKLHQIEFCRLLKPINYTHVCYHFPGDSR